MSRHLFRSLPTSISIRTSPPGSPSGKHEVFRKANARRPQTAVADKERSAAQAATAPCCSEGAPKAELVAMTEPKVTKTAARFQANGKKPNIVFIMGDDIGMWNI